MHFSILQHTAERILKDAKFRASPKDLCLISGQHRHDL